MSSITDIWEGGLVLPSAGRKTPKFRASATTNVAAAAATWNITRPTGTNTSFLLAIAFVQSAAGVTPSSAGWNEISVANNGSNFVAVFARPANGSSDPATFAFAFSGGGTATGVAVMMDYTPSVAVSAYSAENVPGAAAAQAPSIEAPTGTIVEIAFTIFSVAVGSISVTTNVNSPTTEVAVVTQGNQAIFVVDYAFTGVGATTGDTFTSTGTAPQCVAVTVAMV